MITEPIPILEESCTHIPLHRLRSLYSHKRRILRRRPRSRHPLIRRTHRRTLLRSRLRHQARPRPPSPHRRLSSRKHHGRHHRRHALSPRMRSTRYFPISFFHQLHKTNKHTKDSSPGPTSGPPPAPSAPPSSPSCSNGRLPQSSSSPSPSATHSTSSSTCAPTPTASSSSSWS